MKHSFHIQPSQFEYIGFEYDSEEELTSEVITRGIDDYRRSKGMLKSGEGLSGAEMDVFVQNMVEGESNHISQYEKASPEQQTEIQRLKRAIKRANYKITKNNKQ